MLLHLRDDFACRTGLWKGFNGVSSSMSVQYTKATITITIAIS